MAIEITNMVSWLKNWFYDKTEVYKKEETYSKTEMDTALGTKLNKNLTTANKMLVTGNTGDVELADKPVIPDVSGFIDTAGAGLSKSGTTLNHSNSVTAQSSAVFKKIKFDGQGHITGIANVEANDIPTHPHITDQIIELASLSNIGTSSGASQLQVNNAINTAIGNLQSIKAIEVVSTLPTASASTMGKLYIISENSKINVYYTEENNGSYSWHKMDADILDELSIDWSEIENNPFSSSTPSSFANASHTHGNITNEGTITQSYTGYDITYFLTVNTSDKIVKARHLRSWTISNANALSNIGTSANASQESINTAIDTIIGNLQSSTITSISLVPKSTDANGKIIFYTGDEPSP